MLVQNQMTSRRIVSYKTHHCRTINLAARLRPDTEKDEGRNERYAVAEEDIFPLERPELFCVVFPEECEVNITRHSEGPYRIGDHKPVADQSVTPDSSVLEVDKAYH